MNEYHPTDYHREIISRYYGKLVLKFGLSPVLRHIPKLKQVVWTRHGLGLTEKHLKIT